ncbi:MAG: hypothetical protein WCD86_13400 [Ktedonobacteraceae bacterium]
MSLGDLLANPLFTQTDIAQIQEALRFWGKPQEIIEQYGEATFYKQLDCWKQFVSFHWDEDWQSEYDHDIGCRYWLQLAIEYTTLPTRERLQTMVRPFDEIFQDHMEPTPLRNHASPGPFQGQPYFWEMHTIMPSKAKLRNMINDNRV